MRHEKLSVREDDSVLGMTVLVVLGIELLLLGVTVSNDRDASLVVASFSANFAIR